MVSAEGDVVCEGDHVVLDVNNGERLVVTQVTRKTKVKLSKRGYASVMPLLGKAYGTIFEVSVDGKCLEVGTEETLSVLNGSFKTKSTERNNAKLVDDGTAQKLGHEDIERMKAQGVKSGNLLTSWWQTRRPSRIRPSSLKKSTSARSRRSTASRSCSAGPAPSYCARPTSTSPLRGSGVCGWTPFRSF